VIYRDDELALAVIAESLRREAIALGRDPRREAARSLRAQIRRAQRSGERAARACARRRDGFLWLVPRSVTELVVACALVYASLTVVLSLVFVVVCVVALV
jgi:hypothetical protein